MFQLKLTSRCYLRQTMGIETRFWFLSGIYSSLVVNFIAFANFIISRIRPSEESSPWDVTASRSTRSIKLQPHYHKNPGTSPPEFNFDEMLTGSENKPIYNAVAKSHVTAAMEGYNAIVFAYGQTASGKTFTLVCLLFELFRIY
jgi:chromosomal replication initiation ATPase DnaA